MADNEYETNLPQHASETGSETNTPFSSETENEESDDELQIVIDRVKAVTIKVPVLVQGKDAKAVVDTGAEVTVLNSDIYFSIPQKQRPILKKAKRNLVVAEAGKEMRTEGMADIMIRLGDTTFEWTVYIAPIHDDILLGCDIIDEKDITVNTKKGLQIEDNKWISCEIIRSKEKSSKVQVSRAVTIPAYSEFKMRGQCSDITQEEDKTYIFEATEEAKQQLLIARCVINPHSNKVPLRLINLSHRPIKLKKGFIIGELQVVGSVSSTGTMVDLANHEEGHSVCRLKTLESKHERLTRDTGHLTIETTQPIDKMQDAMSDLPKHLADLYQNSLSTLNETRRKNLRKLLIKHSETFAKSKTELGTCAVLKHKIETGEAAPVRQPLRRTPQGFEGEEVKYIKEQLAAGAIKPSNSPWSSALVMVRKKTFWAYQN